VNGTWLAWLGTFLLFFCVAHGNFETTDAGFTMHAARGLWLRGDSGLRTQEQGGELIGEVQGARNIVTTQRQSEQGVGQRQHGKIGVNGRAYIWFPMGHVFLMTPFVPVANVLQQAAPDVDARFREKVKPNLSAVVTGTPVITQSLISMLLPSLCIATSIVLLFHIARALGSSSRDAVIAALAIGLSTQMFAVGREQLSDGPGLMLLLAALLPVVRMHRGVGTALTAVWAGLMAGAAVLVRYQTALAVVAFGLVVLLASRRRGRLVDVAWFALGGAPMLVVFLLTNYLRYGDALDTGYPDVSDWYNSSSIAGVAKMLFGAGRGAMWLSPLLWLGIPFALRRRDCGELRWLAWFLLLTPIAAFMAANGWQGGQCWAVRYITPGVVGLLAIALPQALPWRRWPRTWWALVAFGAFVALTSVVAPVRGVLQLGSQAVAAQADRAVAAGELDPAERARIDAADVTGWQPRYSPLLANWRYALRSHVGGFEGEDGRPRHGGEHTIEPLFGVAPVTPAQGHAPMRWEDRCGRHLWWRFWADLTGTSSWLLLLPPLLLAALCSWFGWRRLASGPEPVDPVPPSAIPTAG